MNQPLFAALRRTYCLLLFIAITTPVQSQKLDTAALYRITNVTYPDKSLALSFDGTNNLPVLRTTADQPTQHWKLKLDKYGNYRFINFRQGKTFSVEVVNDAEKNKLVLGSTKDLASQAWKISTKTPGVYRITCLWLGTDKALAVVESTEANNILTMAQTNAAAKTQEWKFTKLPPPTPMQMAAPTPQPQIPENLGFIVDTTALYYLSTQWQGEGKTLGVKPGTNHQVELQDKKDVPTQFWKFQLTPSGYYRLVNSAHLSKSLDIVNDGKANNQLTLATSQNYSGQFWKVSVLGDGSFVRFTSLWQGDKLSIDILNNGVNNQLVMSATANVSGQWWKLSKATQLPPPPPSPVVEVSQHKSTLVAGEELKPGMQLISPNGQYTFVQQKDGNLVLYNAREQALWASGTNGRAVEKCILQPDGNLVQYLPYKVSAWAAGTNGNAGAYLTVQDDGNVVIYSKEKKALWATHTNQ